MASIFKTSFSGHESFPCKSLWLKKGYDFVRDGGNFAAPDAVVKLGVGKNMVAAIRYWLRAFGLLSSDRLTEMAHFLFDDDQGRDPFAEDLGTLWLLHHQLLTTHEATLYDWCFVQQQRERKTFDREQLQRLVKRIFAEQAELAGLAADKSTLNLATLNKDIGVLLQNYVSSHRTQSSEEYTALLLDLQLLVSHDGKSFAFNTDRKPPLPHAILLYALLCEGEEKMTLDFPQLQRVALRFCMTDGALITALQQLQQVYPHLVQYNDTAGMRQLHFSQQLSPTQVLVSYYDHVAL